MVHYCQQTPVLGTGFGESLVEFFDVMELGFVEKIKKKLRLNDHRQAGGMGGVIPEPRSSGIVRKEVVASLQDVWKRHAVSGGGGAKGRWFLKLDLMMKTFFFFLKSTDAQNVPCEQGQSRAGRTDWARDLVLLGFFPPTTAVWAGHCWRALRPDGPIVGAPACCGGARRFPQAAWWRECPRAQRCGRISGGTPNECPLALYQLAKG